MSESNSCAGVEHDVEVPTGTTQPSRSLIAVGTVSDSKITLNLHVEIRLATPFFNSFDFFTRP